MKDLKVTSSLVKKLLLVVKTAPNSNKDLELSLKIKLDAIVQQSMYIYNMLVLKNPSKIGLAPDPFMKEPSMLSQEIP